MLKRFKGPENKDRLVQELLRQTLVAGDQDVARAVAKYVELMQFEAGTEFITQGGADDDLFFILAGRASVIINGHEMAIRQSGEHVGEISLLDPSLPRIASVIALDRTVVARIAESDFRKLGADFPTVWRAMSLCLAQRLRQRSGRIPVKNPRPVVFIGSSSEAISIAEILRNEIEKADCIVKIWTDNVFKASSFAILDLEEQIRSSDFAILILTGDDEVMSRTLQSQAPRDNIVFELGLFMGAISHSRTFMLVPQGVDVKLPSDLLGLTRLTYEIGSADEKHTSIASVVKEIYRVMENLGPK